MSPAFVHCFCQAESPLSNLNSQSDPKNRTFRAVLKYILLMITESFYSANSIFIFLSIHLYGSIDIRTTGFPVDSSSAFLTFIAHKHSCRPAFGLLNPPSTHFSWDWSAQHRIRLEWQDNSRPHHKCLDKIHYETKDFKVAEKESCTSNCKLNYLPSLSVAAFPSTKAGTHVFQSVQRILYWQYFPENIANYCLLVV